MVSVERPSDGDAGVAGETGVIPLEDEEEEGREEMAAPYKSSSV